ncbi:MAG: L-glutamate gamma-semialdehyde dehydrogenase, partial [Chloroflexi bacterium]|nr:L-glutamate gamma-semialdehyde dehydrogenase [Chloroflexota bacterium]
MEYPPFANEPLSDFSDPARRATFAHTLARVDAELGPTWSRSMLIGGEKVETGAWLESHDPTTPSRVVGRVATATP